MRGYPGVVKDRAGQFRLVGFQRYYKSRFALLTFGIDTKALRRKYARAVIFLNLIVDHDARGLPYEARRVEVNGAGPVIDRVVHALASPQRNPH